MYKLGSKASFPSSPTTNNETHQKLQQGGSGGGGGGGAARQRQRQRRVSFSAEVRRVLLPRIAYTDLVGDVRDPGHNPNYAALGQARACRLRCFSDGLVAAKAFHGWRACRGKRVESATPTHPTSRQQ